MTRAGWIRTVAALAFGLCLIVVVLGAYVRLSAAGLGCPDWPGCYGHLTPTGAAADAGSTAGYSIPLQTGKAWREMIHRYAASTLGLLIVVIAAMAWAWRRERVLAPVYAFALLAIVVLQGVLGMLTVTWLLKPLVVTLHLLFGLTTLALLWWLVLTLGRRRGAWPPSAWARSLCRSRSAAGPAAITRRSPARIFRAARVPGGRRPTTSRPSCCGAAWA
jgi:cytochrome c oxidase assembly protein subunit 15